MRILPNAPERRTRRTPVRTEARTHGSSEFSTMKMRSLKTTLISRLDAVTRPEPTVIIHHGEEFYISDNGAQETKRSTYVKFSVKFREAQLAQLKGATLGVFICLALHIEQDGTCFPSVNLICKETGYNRDTVFDALSKLEFRGYIARKQKTDAATKKFKSNVYQLFPKSVDFKAKSRAGKSPCR